MKTPMGLESPAVTTRRIPRPAAAAVALILAVFFLVSGVLSSIGSVGATRTADAFEVDRWAACYFGDDSVPAFIYSAVNTDEAQFNLRSKSASTSGLSDVDGAMNSMLSMFGNDFKAVNERIIGTSLDPANPSEEIESADEDAEELFNTGARVNPFDRFGVAGLNFTSYNGEWRYVVINACSPTGEPTDPKAGVFYEERLEPQSTWDDIPNSDDVRTQQFDQGFWSQFGSAFLNVAANWTFVITKLIVVLTIAFVSFSFTDIVTLIGLDEILGGDGGIFVMLFDGLFTPLIIIPFVITGGFIFYQGIVKRRARESLNVLVRSLALFFAAILISVAPAFWVSAPNAIATVGQSIIVTALNSGLSGGSGLCETDVANAQIIDDKNKNGAGLLEQASKNMSSAINCQFWQTFLLTPWSQGQWGTGWENTYAQGAEPNVGTLSDWDQLDYDNEDMVSDAAVPLGNEEFVNNWAIFNISTNTNAHSPLEHPGELSKVTNGVANDWYRIVDALANYQEETVQETAFGSGGNDHSDGENQIEYMAPIAAEVADEWNTWVGNEASNRIWIALSSVLIAGVGLAGPLVFSFLSAVFSIGVSLLASLAPLFLLLGVWADRGWNIFLGWASMLLNTMIARIVLGAMVAISVALTMSIISMMDDIGWWQGILLLIVVSIVLIQSRQKIMNAVRFVRMSAIDFQQTASSVVRKTTGAAKGTGRGVISGVGGGVVARRHGGSFTRGVGKALGTEVKNQMYRNPHTSRAMGQFEEVRMARRPDHAKHFVGHYTCNACGGEIAATPERNGTSFYHGARDDNGNIYCYQCFNDGVRDDLREMTVEVPKGDIPEYEQNLNLTPEQEEVNKIVYERFDPKRSVYNSSNAARHLRERVQNSVDRNGETVSAEENLRQLKALMKYTNYDIDRHRDSGGNQYPQPPAEIADYMDADLVAAAWREQDYVWLRASYTAAWVNWFQDETGQIVHEKLDELLASVENMNTSSDPDDQDGTPNDGGTGGTPDGGSSGQPVDQQPQRAPQDDRNPQPTRQPQGDRQTPQPQGDRRANGESDPQRPEPKGKQE